MRTLRDQQNAGITIFWSMVIAGCIILICSIAHAGISIDERMAVLAVIGEAEGEPYTGKVAVAEVIRRRGSLKGVYGVRSSRVINHKYSQATYAQCLKAWRESVNTNHSKNATHWEGASFKKPSWAKNMVITVVIGNQVFYREA